MKTLKLVSKTLTVIVKKVAVSASHSVSIGGFHQPKEPKALQNLKWYRTNITNFYGGDNTMYETQWKTVTIDVEQYAGKAIKLEFNENNVGDNTYNSAVLIDNVLVA